MKARSREEAVTSDFTLTESLTGHFSSSILPLDIPTWNQSVPLETARDASLDFLDMANQYLEPDVLKDDTQSVSSSMNDSAYMSQPDMSHLHQGTVQINAMQYAQPTTSSSHEHTQSAGERFVHPDMLSPTLSSTSPHSMTFFQQRSDMNAFMLPPDRLTNKSGILSSSTPMSAMFLESGDASSPYVTRATENPSLWSANNSELFNAAMLQRNSSMMRGQIGHRMSLNHGGFSGSLFNDAGDRETANQLHGSSVGSQARSFNFRSSSTPMLSTAGFPFGRPEADRRSSSTTIQGMQDISMTASPAQSTASHFGSIATVQNEPFSYIDYDGGHNTLDPAAASTPHMAPSILSDSGSAEPQQHGRVKARAVRPIEDAAARSDPLYHRMPGNDDLYHCPFADEGEDCGHKPTKLKCNYDKYIDSHLKPFRCKHSTCIDVQFSSTACLLRHEREAHGMHGHGSKPNLCLYPECERSQPGNGFPRRYNLYDHMRRVHDYAGPTTSPEAHTSTVAPEPVSLKKDRKRRISTVDDTPTRPDKRPRSRAVSSASMLPPPSPSLKSQPATIAPAASVPRSASTTPHLAASNTTKRSDNANLHEKFEQKRTILKLRIESLSALDVTGFLRFQEDVGELGRIAIELRGLG